jgi:hypothetical protein
LAGIGDHQSIGRLYAGTKKEVEPGDTVKFLGQRKFFGLGVYTTYMADSARNMPGLLWWWTFTDGWGLKWMWVGYSGFLDIGNAEIRIEYLFPLALRKHIIYPAVFSPFVGVSMGYWADYVSLKDYREQYGNSGIGIFPVAGIELLQTRLFHVHLDGTYMHKTVNYGENNFQISKWFFSFGVTTNW